MVVENGVNLTAGSRTLTKLKYNISKRMQNVLIVLNETILLLTKQKSAEKCKSNYKFYLKIFTELTRTRVMRYKNDLISTRTSDDKQFF